MINIVEMCEDECFNQKCKYGNLVEGHAVYCHSEHPDAPRKCRHTWYFGEDEKGMQDEDCPYFEPNPNLAPISEKVKQTPLFPKK